MNEKSRKNQTLANALFVFLGMKEAPPQPDGKPQALGLRGFYERETVQGGGTIVALKLVL